MKNKLSHKRNSCRLCNSKRLILRLYLPKSQPVDHFRKKNDKDILLPKFKMNLYQCLKCGHAQLLDVVNPKILYGNYIYRSSKSPDLKKHFFNYSKYVFSKKFIKKGEKVLDIGSNDGLFLDFLKKKGLKTYGIDPAKNISKIAKKKNHKIICEYLNKSSTNKIKSKFSNSFKLITANNVFSHSDNLQDMIKNISNLLNNDGTYIFEVSYFLDTIKNRVVDYIYHEHLSYHSIKALVPFLKKEKLYIYDLIKIPTKGGSIRVCCGKNKKKENKKLIKLMIAEEKKFGLYKSNIYKLINKEIKNSKDLLKNFILKEIKKNKEIDFFGYGACATGTVLINILGIDKYFKGLIEDNTDKINKFSPNSFLPVSSLIKANKNKNIFFIIVAWRFEEQILKNIRKINKKAKIICVKPTLKKIKFL